MSISSHILPISIFMTTFAKDWAPPRSLRSSTSMPMGGVANPSGTTLHVMVNTRIPCNEEAFKKHGKSHASMTIVAIKKIGYVYAPWKKTPKKGEAKEATKKLFDSPVMVKNKNEQIYGEVSVYSFSRVGKSDKGPRNDALKGKIEVGQTLHFMLHQFMFERKSKGESVFPEGVEFIEPFSMVELVVGAGVDEQATQGYGIKIDTIRPLPFSMYSYLIPVYMDILEDTPERIHQKVTEGTKEEGGDYYTLRQVLETTSVGFLVKVDPASYLVELKDGEDKSFYRVVVEGDDKMVAEGVNMVDVMEGDLLKFTNAGDNVKYAHLLVDMAAAGNTCLFLCLFLFISCQVRIFMQAGISTCGSFATSTSHPGTRRFVNSGESRSFTLNPSWTLWISIPTRRILPPSSTSLGSCPP